MESWDMQSPERGGENIFSLWINGTLVAAFFKKLLLQFLLLKWTNAAAIFSLVHDDWNLILSFFFELRYLEL